MTYNHSKALRVAPAFILCQNIYNFYFFAIYKYIFI